jgi:CheY-like chemotaxis protein
MKPTILLVDDDVQWLSALGSLLDDVGYGIITATNVSNAIAVLEERPDIGMVLIDLVLPERDGEAPQSESGMRLLEFIRTKHDRLPIIVISAYLEPHLRDLQHAGVSSLISKGHPDALDEIQLHLAKAMHAVQTKPRDEPAEHQLLAKLRTILAEEMAIYAPLKERTIYIPQEGQYELIKPLVGFKKDIENQLARFPFSKNVFLMMKFRETNRELAEFIIESLASHGLCGVRADHDDWNITKNVYNPIAVLYCCKYGIALFDEAEQHQAYSPNVAYELGMMHYQNKHCLILRHASLPVVPFDLIKDLYETYERDLRVRQIIASWIRQVAIRLK